MEMPQQSHSAAQPQKAHLVFVGPETYGSSLPLYWQERLLVQSFLCVFETLLFDRRVGRLIHLRRHHERSEAEGGGSAGLCLWRGR